MLRVTFLCLAVRALVFDPWPAAATGLLAPLTFLLSFLLFLYILKNNKTYDSIIYRIFNE